MGLFDWFVRQIRCPECGDGRARQPLFGRIRCPNRACSYFDARLAGSLEEEGLQAESAPIYRKPHTRERITKPKAAEAFNPWARAIQVRYQNYRGEATTFTSHPLRLRRPHNPIPSRI